MGIEIERKFLIKNVPSLPSGHLIVQGYLSEDPCIRVRLTNVDVEDYKYCVDWLNKIRITNLSTAELTIKGKGSLVRPEFNFSIPLTDGIELLSMCGKSLLKRRFSIGKWELDYFYWLDCYIAEVELSDKDESVEIPNWVGKEVTEDLSYTSYSLAKKIESFHQQSNQQQSKSSYDAWINDEQETALSHARAWRSLIQRQRKPYS